MSSSLMQEEEQMVAVQQPPKRALVQPGSVADLVVQAAVTANRLITENCGLCTLYCDKQVQYESSAMEQYVTAGAGLEQLFEQVDSASPQVEEYREMLFDEESVVTSVSSRAEG
eukprot:Nitzschia sp. Nitz4//scaffold108_size72880//48831//49172//NITZ4_005821-RA/size72880-processed-gene-0.40-mRNA-1//1//CDS//3329532687//1603//frame0